MYYIKLATLEFPRHIGDIWLEHPDLINQYVCPQDYAKVSQTEPPAYDRATQQLSLGKPINTPTGWEMTWEVRNFTEAELDAMAVAQAELDAQAAIDLAESQDEVPVGTTV